MKAEDAALSHGTNQEELVMKVLIDNEIRNLLRPLNEDECRTLRTNLKAYGPIAPFPYWYDGRNNILLDCHHTRKICISEKIPFTYRKMEFSSRDEAMQWVLNNQLGRRNLTEDQARYARGKDYLDHKKAHGGSERFPSCQNGNMEETQGKRTSAVIAAKHGVSERTIHRDAKFAEEVDAMPPKEKAEVLSGNTTAKQKKPKAPAKFSMKRIEAAVGVIGKEIRLFELAYDAPGQTITNRLHEFLDALQKWTEAHLPKVEGCERPGKCRHCGADIIWTKTKNDKFIPLDAAECMKVTKRSFAIKDGIATKAAGSPRYLPHLVTCTERKK
ncbi:MAG TPA: hypothetical protein VKE98_01025 [Gemmataceae bacterium]|nr:hypothetical protein [Gemmataceae bacterium]